MPLDVEELEPTTRNDYRRANGAPMVMVDGKNERYSRPSSFAKPLDDESALINWKLDRVAFGVARDRALQARWCAVEDDDRETKAKLREDSIAAGRGAERADIGTALHAMSVRFENDLSFSPPQPYLDSLQAYMNEMQRLNLMTVRSEFHTVNREYRCAGTADRLYELGSPLVTPTGEVLPVGTLIIGDLKTGEKLEYSKPAYAVQTFLYAEGEFYDVLLDDFVATPPINRQWGIIVHMPVEFPGTCEFLWVDLEVGRHGAYIVQLIKTWRKMWRSGEFDMPPLQLSPTEPTCWCRMPEDTSLVHQIEAPCYPHVTALQSETVTMTTILDAPVAESTKPPSVEGNGSTYGVAEYTAWFKTRINLIAVNEGARRRLTTIWPPGLPTPKQGIDDTHVPAIRQLLDQIEAEYQLGFVEGGPPTTGHRSTRNKKG
jgi:hypothetical protein